MKRSYWEDLAPKYNDEIFDVLQNDKQQLVKTAIEKLASPNKTVIDAGCAIGKWLPLLSPLFKQVYALDISAKNLKIARKKNPELNNVEYIRADMSRKNHELPVCDLGICINAILTPSVKKRNRFFQSLASCIKQRGKLIMTVPSMESFMLTRTIQKQFKIDKKYFPVVANYKQAIRNLKDIWWGVAEIDDVPHKHFLKEEAAIVLQQFGFAAEKFQKIEYDWSTEFYKPPAWLQQPGPWDWMIVAKRV